MATSSLVSINIPVYKCEDYILRCLESVKKQTYKNLEIILVNDCTPDNSIALVEQFKSDNPDLTIRILQHKMNQGLSVVRNTGIDNSKGEFLFFLDSDDEIVPNCIELLLKNIEVTKAEMVMGQNRWINTFDDSTKDFGFPTKSKKNRYNSNEEIFSDYCYGKFPVPSWNKLVRVDFLRDNQLYFVPGLYAQDELWFFHVMLKINSLSIIDEITYLYYLHGQSVIFNRNKRNFENYQTILEYFSKAYHESKGLKRKLIMKRVINFRSMVMIMQWKAMKGDVDYLKKNYTRMKLLPRLSISNYFDSFFSLSDKKNSFQQNLPTDIGVKLFVKRYG